MTDNQRIAEALGYQLFAVEHLNETYHYVAKAEIDNPLWRQLSGPVSGEDNAWEFDVPDFLTDPADAAWMEIDDFLHAKNILTALLYSAEEKRWRFRVGKGEIGEREVVWLVKADGPTRCAAVSQAFLTYLDREKTA